MIHQISPSSKWTSIIILFSLLSVTYSAKVLIICTDGCGCVTEEGESVNCPFIPSNETAVLQSKRFKAGFYQATRVIPIGTVFDVDIETKESFNDFCPDTAGFTPTALLPFCYPVVKPTRTPPKPALLRLRQCNNVSAECFLKEVVDGPNVGFEISFIPDIINTTREGEPPTAVGAAVFGLATCRAKPLKKR